MPSPMIYRVKLENYRSISKCNVILGPLTVLVGPNGAGKSNFLDALRFLRDGLRNTLDQAIRDRGGIIQVRRLSTGHPHHFGISVELQLETGQQALYALQIGSHSNGKFRVAKETCEIRAGHLDSDPQRFAVEDGRLKEGAPGLPKSVESDRLFLTLLSATPAFRPVYDALSRGGFYNLNPDRLKDVQNPDPGEILERDGRNIASIIRRMREENSPSWGRILEYLRAAVPGIEDVKGMTFGPKETVEFSQAVAGSKHAWHFPASGMSDGTLRFLGVLVALFQDSGVGLVPLHRRIPMIGIEEPEVAIHPGAALKLMDAILEAKEHTQILITTHSPELLSHPNLESKQIRVVDTNSGVTRITEMDHASKSIIQDKLMTAGDLLTSQQLAPSMHEFEQSVRQMKLFSFSGSIDS
ncbi:MAG: AAA family ATPase [Sulfobacillus sp.]